MLPFIAQQSTFFVLTATASNGCQASDTMFLIAKTAPDVPEIKFDGTVLRTDAPGSWQWWLDFLPIAGATAKELTPVAPGNYQVQVTNASGCSRYSDFFDYQPAWPLWFLDADGDGFGTPGSAVFAPQMPSGYAASSSDCNDQNAQISPATPETCNGSDDNCDSLTDNVPPSAVCGSFLTIFLGGGGSFLLAPEQILLSGGDACFPGTETLALDKETFDCSEIGTDFTVTLTLTTLFGETATCQTTVSLEDASPPIAFCAAADTVHLDSSGMLAWPPDNVDAGSFDACGPLNLASSPAFFTLADTGANILTLTATDAAGLSATCTTVLTILPPGTLGAGDFFEKSEAFQIFPNPTSAWLRVLWPQKAGERARCLLVFNALGQKMLEMPLPIGAENAAWLDLRNLESGVYWIGLDSGAGKFILKNGTAE